MRPHRPKSGVEEDRLDEEYGEGRRAFGAGELCELAGGTSRLVPGAWDSSVFCLCHGYRGAVDDVDAAVRFLGFDTGERSISIAPEICNLRIRPYKKFVEENREFLVAAQEDRSRILAKLLAGGDMQSKRDPAKPGQVRRKGRAIVSPYVENNLQFVVLRNAIVIKDTAHYEPTASKGI
jgi:hypothetical protein